MNFIDFILWLFVVLVVFGSVFVFFQLYIFYSSKKRRKNIKMMTVVIRAVKDNELTPRVAEQIFSSLHGILRDFSFFEKIKGFTQDIITFEIGNIDSVIKFYVTFPVNLKDVVEGQIYAQYPGIELEEVKNPLAELNNKFVQKGEFDKVVGADIGLQNFEFFPVKTFSQFEDNIAGVSLDPLAGITSSLAKLNNTGDQAWISLSVRPMSENWRKVFLRCIGYYSSGVSGKNSLKGLLIKLYSTRNKFVRILFYPFYLVLSIVLSFKNVSSKESVGDSSILGEQKNDSSDLINKAKEKVGKLLYEANLRLLYVPVNYNKESSLIKIREIAGSFKQFNVPDINGFVIRKINFGYKPFERFLNKDIVSGFVLNTEELATVFHLPNNTVTTSNIFWVRSRRLEPPSDLPFASDEQKNVTTLGNTNFRGVKKVFGVKALDRRRHVYVIGKTGMGKSTLLENMIYSDIMAGNGVAVVDPHGDLADNVLNFVPSYRTNDVVIFDPSDRDFPVAFNMFENIDSSLNSIVCSGLVGIFKKIYAESWGPRLEHILRNSILSLLEYPGATMLGIPRLLQDEVYRAKVLKKVTDPIVKRFWIDEFSKMDLRQRTEAISPILNKVGQFLSSPIIRNILGQPKSAIDLRFAMDKGKIVIINLSKGKIGEDNSSLLGSMMITKFQLDAMSRANIPEKDRKDFYLYVDEFQNFATDSFATILSEARKYRLNLTIANQYVAQMPEEVKDAVFGNVGTILSFQVGFDDAVYISSQFGEEVDSNDLVSMNKYMAYTRLLIDGMPSNTFSLDTLPPPLLNHEDGRLEKIIKLARERYSTPRHIVEDKIKRWSESVDVNSKKPAKKNTKNK